MNLNLNKENNLKNKRTTTKQGTVFKMGKVNLDALIPREDFEIKDEILSKGTGQNISTLGVNDLRKSSFFLSSARKPDFQRETNEWDAEKIVVLIESFLNGDLIPSVILWKSEGGYVFVIDGSHRLSALTSWINNDYGDGDVSKQFYDKVISDEQNRIAEETRALIRRRIGHFSDYELAMSHPEKVKKEILERAKGLGALAIQLQWVYGNADR